MEQHYTRDIEVDSIKHEHQVFVGRWNSEVHETSEIVNIEHKHQRFIGSQAHESLKNELC